MATVTTTPGKQTTAERSADLNVLVRKQRSLWQDAWYRLLRNRAAVVGMVIVVLFMILAVTVPFMTQLGWLKDPLKQDTPNSLMEPIWTGSKFTLSTYPFGSDQLGRDILSRLLWSTQISMLVGFVPVSIIFLVGVTIGLAAGYYGGWVDQILMRITDVIYAFPDLLFLFIIMATLRNTALGDIQGGLLLIFVAIAVVNWVGMARLVRGQVLSLKEREFIEAARSIGAPARRIMVRHLFPNILAPVIVSVAFGIPSAMLAEATLSFFGIGIKPPTASWGVMINEGFVVFSTSAWPVLLPALCISIVMLAFTFLGDGLRDALDPRMKI
ncbi:MAG TPA: ABC transporter permease [Methylomirabilota bacterium]|nr:ABC transporter permease [Methylomirabilota bacterium]